MGGCLVAGGVRVVVEALERHRGRVGVVVQASLALLSLSHTRFFDEIRARCRVMWNTHAIQGQILALA